MSNIRIEFVDPDCTGFLQPLDVGIINSFKAHYQKYHCRHISEKNSKEDFSPIILHDAIRMIKKAWDEISSETIVNCWKHTGLIKSEGSTKKQNRKALKKLQDEINKLTDIEHPLSAIEFINIIKSLSTFKDLTI